ncbi:hypothetical protein CSC14_1938 [Proteus mirabilis]|nr:hypothetical protein CSC14_1938 [Proteus mirabilis]
MNEAGDKFYKITTRRLTLLLLILSFKERVVILSKLTK